MRRRGASGHIDGEVVCIQTDLIQEMIGNRPFPDRDKSKLKHHFSASSETTYDSSVSGPLTCIMPRMLYRIMARHIPETLVKVNYHQILKDDEERSTERIQGIIKDAKGELSQGL